VGGFGLRGRERYGENHMTRSRRRRAKEPGGSGGQVSDESR
jgi:hypothetical protein